jgi:hypothetical protein
MNICFLQSQQHPKIINQNSLQIPTTELMNVLLACLIINHCTTNCNARKGSLIRTHIQGTIPLFYISSVAMPHMGKAASYWYSPMNGSMCSRCIFWTFSVSSISLTKPHSRCSSVPQSQAESCIGHTYCKIIVHLHLFKTERDKNLTTTTTLF